LDGLASAAWTCLAFCVRLLTARRHNGRTIA
jgi:hypothetical protein